MCRVPVVLALLVLGSCFPGQAQTEVAGEGAGLDREISGPFHTLMLAALITQPTSTPSV